MELYQVFHFCEGRAGGSAGTGVVFNAGVLLGNNGPVFFCGAVAAVEGELATGTRLVDLPFNISLILPCGAGCFTSFRDSCVVTGAKFQPGTLPFFNCEIKLSEEDEARAFAGCSCEKTFEPAKVKTVTRTQVTKVVVFIRTRLLF